jgi:hypothetical protein
MKHTKVLLTMLVCGTMVFGCKKDEKKAPAETPAEAPKTAEPAADPAPVEPTPAPAAEGITPFAAVVSHKVADFDKWKVGFDAHAEARKGAGIMGHHVNQAADDPNMVSIYFPMMTTEKFTEMLASEDLKKVMKEAGVESEPTVHMMKPVDGEPVLDRELFGAIVMHEVEDYAAWRTKFDAHADARAKAGVVGWAVNQAADNENMIIVLLQAEKAEELTAFMGTEDLKKAMAEAGVKGEPKVQMIKSHAGVMY